MLDKKIVLKQYFGHSEFRYGQDQVVDALLHGKDAICVMPTGAGKSICYQVPALIFEGITLVISPLISLMKDQVNALTQNGIRAAYLNSSLTAEEYGEVLFRFRRGAYKLLYVAPERLSVPDFLNACRAVKVDLLAVDEAHCISQWGQDFRPSYLKISEFVNALGYRPVIGAFTATATAEVKDDIEYSLELITPFRITTGFDRPNLRFEVIRPKHKLNEVFDLLERHINDSGIIYCSTRKNVEKLQNKLAESGFSATMYHAGLEEEVRKQNQEDFVYDRKNIMVATNAFGMGIDKSNVSYVIHYNMPKDIESYYQEAGRAGRDGSMADCILLYSPSDVQTNQFLIEHSDPNPDLTPTQQMLLKDRDYERLKQMIFYSTTNCCLRSFILQYFGEKSRDYCGNCSNCLTQFQEVDVTIEAQKILSCIKRTGQRFGKKIICDILRGSKEKRILQLGLDHQTTYGLMSTYQEFQVRGIIDYLELGGYVETKDTQYPTLALTPKAYHVLFEGERIIMKQAKPKEKSMKKPQRGRAVFTEERNLFAVLKVLRRELADEMGVPAYVVFSDATLVDMCQKHPTTPGELLTVSGVGRKKLKKYGAKFLHAIRIYDLGGPWNDVPLSEFDSAIRLALLQNDSPESDFDIDLTDEEWDEEIFKPKKTVKKPKRRPFAIDAEQLQKFEYTSTPLSATSIASNLNLLVKEDIEEKRMKRLSQRKITQWMLDIGMLEYRKGEDGKMKRFPTAEGEEIGLVLQMFERDGKRTSSVYYSESAQHFIIDNMEAVLATNTKKSKGAEQSSDEAE